MARFAARSDDNGVLALDSIEDLRSYCFVVAGLVGEMLTELYLLGRPELAPAADELRRRAAPFGEALQLVNILKDVAADARAGRSYLPPRVHAREVFALADAGLRAAAEYNALLRASGTQQGLWAFNALNTELAKATLRSLRARGLGAKLTRSEVNDLRAQILHTAFGEAPCAGARPA
jgi:farnesyl-diphosphate farnesyltransferase